MLDGALVVWTLPHLPTEAAPRISVAGLDKMDTAGAWYLAEAQRTGTQLEGLKPNHAELMKTVTASIPEPDPVPPVVPEWKRILTRTGMRIMQALGYFE